MWKNPTELGLQETACLKEFISTELSLKYQQTAQTTLKGNQTT